MAQLHRPSHADTSKASASNTATVEQLLRGNITFIYILAFPKPQECVSYICTNTKLDLGHHH